MAEAGISAVALQPLLLRHPAVPSACSPSPSISIGTEAAPKNLLLGILLLPAGIALHACLQLCRVPRSVSWTHSAHCSLLPSQPCFEPQTPLCSTEPYTSAEAESVVCSPLKAPFSPCRPLFLLGEFYVPCVTRSLFFVILPECAGQEVALEQRQPQRQHGVGSCMEGFWGIHAQPI